MREDNRLAEQEMREIEDVCTMVAHYYHRLAELGVPPHVIERLISDYAFHRLLSL